MNNHHFLRACFLAISLFVISSVTYGQEYKLAVGARAGIPGAVSAKYFMGETVAVEGYVGLASLLFGNGISINGAILKHKPLEDVTEGLSWYYGAGASSYIGGYRSIGLQAYIGLDYKFEEYPINASIDWSPSIYFNGSLSGFRSRYGSIAVRYIFEE